MLPRKHCPRQSKPDTRVPLDRSEGVVESERGGCSDADFDSSGR